jgi:glycosyltransferase 2 family protein
VTDSSEKSVATPKRSNWVRWLLRFLGPVILVIVLLRLKDPSEIGRLFLSADPLWILGSLVLNFAAIHTKVIRWQVFLRVRDVHYGLKNAWLAFSASLYLGMLTPGRVGDLLRIQYLKNDARVPYAEGLASIVIDRLCDLYVLAGFVAVAFVRYAPALDARFTVMSWAIVGATVLLPLLLVWPGLLDGFLGKIYARLAKDAESDGLNQFLTALRAQIGRALLVTMPLTVLAYFVTFLQGYMIARALGIPISFFDATCLLAVANLMGLLPISISGVGIREAFFATVFPWLGIEASRGVGFGLLVFAVVYLALAAIGFIAWQIKPPASKDR